MVVALMALTSLWLVGVASADAAGPSYVPNEYIIHARTGTSYSSVQQAVSKMGATIVSRLPLPDTYQIRLGALSRSGVGRVAAVKGPTKWVIDRIQPNNIYYALALPDDPDWVKQWDMITIRCPEAWDIEKGDASVKVAVLDTGVATDHPDLAARCIAGFDFVDNDNDPYDLEGHGTHVSGTIAAQGDNSIGISGVCWENVKIMPVRVLGPQGGTTAWIMGGLDYAMTHGAQVVNMSLGGPARLGDDAYRAKIAQVANAGIVICAAAGNDASDVGLPAAYPEVICVASTGPTDEIAVYSSFGPGFEVDIAAPGGDSRFGGPDGEIWSTVVEYDTATPPNKTLGYTAYQGTSMACPHVAGAAALLFSQGLSAASVRSRLESTARIPPGMYDRRKFGAGILDCAAAVANASVRVSKPGKGLTVSVDPSFKMLLRGIEPNSIKIYFDYSPDEDGRPANPSETPIIDSSNLGLYANTARTEINFTWSQLTGGPLAPGRHQVYVEANPLVGGEAVYDWGVFDVASLTAEAGLYLFALPYAIDTATVAPTDILTNSDFSITNPSRSVLKRYLSTVNGYANYYPGNPYDVAWINPIVGGVPTGGAFYDLVKVDDGTGEILDRRSNQFGYPVGAGFWLILSEASPISDAFDPIETMRTADGYVLDQTKGCRVPLYKGWNLIGNPYSKALPLEGVLVTYQGQTKTLLDAAAAGWISMYVYGYKTSGSTGYENIGPRDMLQPYRAYWFRAMMGTTLPWETLYLNILPQL